MINIDSYAKVQSIAKNTLNELSNLIISGISENELVNNCKSILKNYGIDKTWYYDALVMVSIGEKTRQSISGRKYIPSTDRVKEQDFVTIVLSPDLYGYWGAFAQGFLIVNGKIDKSYNVKNPLVREGHQLENRLHHELLTYATPLITFEDIYIYFNKLIKEAGFKNLDANESLGQSIEKNMSDRKFITYGNKITLQEVKIFAFDTHLGKESYIWGHRKENIYFFEGNQLKEL